MNTQIARFLNADGKELAARLDMPAGTTRQVVLFAHCFTCGKDLKSVKALTTKLTDLGYAVMRFDFAGLGESAGDFAETGLSSNVADLVSAADWLRQTWAPPTLLIGHSFGGTAALAAAPRLSELKAVVTIGAPADPAHVTHLFEDDLDEINRQGRATVSIAGRRFELAKSFLDDVTGARLDEALDAITVPALIMHGPDDAVVSFDNGLKLFSAVGGSKNFVSLDGADHLLSDPPQATKAAEIIGAWFGGLTESLQPSGDVQVPAVEGEVVVAERGTGRFAQVIRVGERHTLLADEPAGIGEDTGPAPYDLLLAGLGACTSMTLRMYADRKGWPLEHVAVKLSHRKIHAKDCEACETKIGRLDLIQRELSIEGPLSQAQLDGLVAIADRCPVHRTLEGEVRIETSTAEF